MSAPAVLAPTDRWRAPIDADRLRDLLPHRWPFLFLDRVTELDPGRRAVGLKNVTVSEPHFAGHFPHESVTPGVLIIEALAQLAGLVAASRPAGDGAGRSYLAAVNRMRFHVPVRPGDQLVLSAAAGPSRDGVAEMQVAARVDRDQVAAGRLIIAY
jgi:3-hydroxyacyl-[acyl-carrier-protein] dehydratase